MSNHSNHEKREHLLTIVRNIIKQDQDLRQKYQIGEKFRFIHDRLSGLLSQVEEGIKKIEEERAPKTQVLKEDEVKVYVYLFNAQGVNLKTWEKFIRPNVFYEHSVNRPIYPDQTSIETFLRAKADKNQHGYLVVIINKNDIIPIKEPLKDSLGSPVIKVREGSLKIEKLLSFHVNSVDYKLSPAGTLEKQG